MPETQESLYNELSRPKFVDTFRQHVKEQEWERLAAALTEQGIGNLESIKECFFKVL